MRQRRHQLIDRRMSLETVEMDASISVYSGQSDRRRGPPNVDIGAVVNLDVDVDSLDSFPVCTTRTITPSP